jgi:hypothetical protein
MKIPEIFFGKKTEVRSNLNIIVNKILKINLEEQFSVINCIDTDSLDNFIINFNVGYNWKKLKDCFYLSELTKLLFFSDRFSGEEIRKIRDENIEYLSKTAWGNLIINNSQNYFFVIDHEYNYDVFYSKYIINRKRCIIILRGIINFFNEYEKIKDNFYHLEFYPVNKFPNEHMLYHYVIGNCSLENIESGNIETNYDLNKCIEIYNKINDDNYWCKLLEERDEKERVKRKQDDKERKKSLEEEIDWYKNKLKNKAQR